MKNLSFLMALVLVLGLPGCCCRKKETAEEPVRRNTVEKYMDTDAADIEELDLGDMEEPGEGDMEEMEEEEEALSPEEELEFDLGDLSDIELEDLLKDIEEPEALEEEEAPVEEETAFHWIDDQSDDELRKLYFSFNHYGIRPDQKDSLVYDIQQVKQLIADAGASRPTIVVEGHACQEGDRAYNVALSEKRAANVADIFVAAGIDRKFIKAVGRGQECPVVMNGRVVNGSREDRAPNRRVEVRVIYT